ncbi:hypothetical protein [Truepera radiovictrix]|uniref:Uncharacterized protein n=1 Tax=Truepera radiovictrix (strain DSM 17093 / CIP 108686 / LMG 22925 / RQ-24) TaxID=649638 RepID=D7CQ21_TRURR|nr:hypothetical protein [Truepera radiovictrix]ADI14805.1 hypothetical protein Trad_1687 [Truepera radiovictrix DSM 17093]WMT56644.1 hypothetical protein RCV51_11585 [Truepera radiovictrix]
MTTEQITLFVSRLLRNEVSRAELGALSPDELTAINLHLYRIRHDPTRHHSFAGPVTFGSIGVAHPPGREGTASAEPRAPRRTFSEAEILAELGVPS